MTKKETLISILASAIILLLGAGVYFFYQAPEPIEPIDQNQIPVINGWKTINDTASHMQFQYPENIDTPYITASDWPPKIQVLTQTFSCIETGSETASAGQTTKITLNNTEVCLIKESEGAAGSTYTQYAYAIQKGEKTVFLTFSLRFVQCSNYNEPNKTACEIERQAFDINSIIGKIISTLRFTQ